MTVHSSGALIIPALTFSCFAGKLMPANLVFFDNTVSVSRLEG